MEISIASDVTHQPLSTSPKRRQPPVATTTTSAAPILDQFQQMRSMISTFLGARQDPTPSPRQSICNYLHTEIEHLEERDFLRYVYAFSVVSWQQSYWTTDSLTRITHAFLCSTLNFPCNFCILGPVKEV